MDDQRDKSFVQKLGSMTADEHGNLIAQRRKQAEDFFSLLPAGLRSLPDAQLALLEPAIVAQLKDIESQRDTWEHKLADSELLGREFPDETTAAIWACSRATGAYLNMTIRSGRPKLILELGTSLGYSTLWMADACKKVGGRIVTVEYLPIKVQTSKEYFAAAGVSDVIESVEGDIAKVLEDWSGPAPDLVFMDPNKEYQNYYLNLLRKIMQPGSVIITDNAFDSHDIAEEYVENLKDGFASVFVALDTAGSIVSVKL